MSQQELIEGYARLKALQSNLPDRSSVEEKYVAEFHSILNLLIQTSGLDLSNFRIPDSELKPIVTGGNYRTGTVDYSDDNYCQQAFMMMKIDGVLTFFEIQSPQPKPKIGFSPP